MFRMSDKPQKNPQLNRGVSIHWTGILDWTTGLSYFPFMDKCLCLFLERSLHVATPFYNQVPGYHE